MSGESSPPEASGAGWFQDRLGWSGIAASLAGYRAPRRSFVFYLGCITVFLMLMQVLSGILLVLYYQPDAAQAYSSVERIAGEIPYGALVRNVHAWAGDLFVASIFAHMFTVLVRRSFRPPHELSWLSGTVLLFIGIGLAFTGAILPWSETAYTHARVGSGLAKHVPLIGGWLRTFLRGGEEVGSATLGHAYGFHIAALPAVITLLVAAHLFFLSRKPAQIAEPGEVVETIPIYPDFFVRQAAALTGVFVVVMTLATFVERPLGLPVDPRGLLRP